MLSKKTFNQGLRVLSALKQGKQPVDLSDQFTLTVWYEALKDLTDESFTKACIYMLKTSIWHPSPVEIREAAGFSVEVAEQSQNSTAEDQWDIFSTKILAYGINKFQKMCLDNQDLFSHKTTQHVAEIIAEDFCKSNISESGNWRARFISTFNNMKEHGKKSAEMKAINNLMDLVSIPGQTKKELQQ
ncbi:MAG: hypothetical protein C0602_00030 [Denitrovibrio sp.]|nr:MAG: hypothetical protein C0602_00030 [Denitrovibrio sp.]